MDLPPMDYYLWVDNSAISAEVRVEKRHEHPHMPEPFRWPPNQTAVYYAEGGATAGGAADVVRTTSRFATGGATAGGAAGVQTTMITPHTGSLGLSGGQPGVV